MAKKKPSEDKAVRPAEDKLARDQAALEHRFDPQPSEASDHRVTTCYNPACSDYRRPRDDGSKCSCRKTSVGSLT